MRESTQNLAIKLPHLQPGMRLLDCGCGPGSITFGLIAAVAPGEVVGIDIDAGSVNMVRQFATEQSIANVRFEVANLYELPFPAGSFDVAFSHAVLLHQGLRTRRVDLREVPNCYSPYRKSSWALPGGLP